MLQTAYSCYVKKVSLSLNHSVDADQRYLKNRLLKFYYVTTTNACSSKGLFAAATYSTNQTNKAVCVINQSIFNMKSMEQIQSGYDSLSCKQ